MGGDLKYEAGLQTTSPCWKSRPGYDIEPRAAQDTVDRENFAVKNNFVVESNRENVTREITNLRGNDQ